MSRTVKATIGVMALCLTLAGPGFVTEASALAPPATEDPGSPATSLQGSTLGPPTDTSPTGSTLEFTGDIVVAMDRSPATAAPESAAAGQPSSPTVPDSVLADAGRRLGFRLHRVRALGGGAVLVGGATSASAPAAADALADQPGVAFAEPDRRVRLAALPVPSGRTTSPAAVGPADPAPPEGPPNDPYYPRQWNLTDPTAGIGAPGAWRRSLGDGVVVAVLDTGLVAHPELHGRVATGYDFVSDPRTGNDGDGRDPDPTDPGDWTEGECGPATRSTWHGTRVAGVVAAARGNAVGIAGVAPGSTILPVRVLGRCGGTLSDVADALTWASGGTVPGTTRVATPAAVANLSLNVPGRCPAMVQSAIDDARARGTTVVVAAGNSSADAASFTPSGCAGVITVAASNDAGHRSGYSNTGAAVTLAAPGGEAGSGGIVTTADRGPQRPAGPGYVVAVGTSMASAHVAGTTALLLSQAPGLSPRDVADILVRTARRSCQACGAGVLDAAEAVSALPEPRVRPARITRITPKRGPTAGGGVVTIRGTGFDPRPRVTFGGIPATVVSASPTGLTVRPPAVDRAGTVDVQVATPWARSKPSSTSRYRYVQLARAPGYLHASAR